LPTKPSGEPVYESGGDCWATRAAEINEYLKDFYRSPLWLEGKTKEEVEEDFMSKKIHTKKVAVTDFKLVPFGVFKPGSLWLMRMDTQMLLEGIWFYPHRTHNRPDETLVPENAIVMFQGVGNKVMQDGRQRFYLFFLWEEKTIYMYWTYDQVTNVGGMNSELYRFFHGRLMTLSGERV